MSIDYRPTHSLVKIASTEGGFIFNATHRPTDELLKAANAAASRRGTRIVFTGMASRPTDDLIQIGRAGKGCIQFAP